MQESPAESVQPWREPGLETLTERRLYRFETCEIDTARREIRRDGVLVDCEPRAYAVLAYLVERSERVVSNAELRAAIWPGDTLSGGVLARSIWGARRAVGDSGQAQRVIRTVQRHGYRFVAPIIDPSVPGDPVVAPAPTVVASSKDAAMGFVGRQAELSELDRLLQLAIGGTPRLAWVSGEAGAGKTRLAEEFAQLARRRGVQIHTGRVPQATGVPPYWLWCDLFESLFETLSHEALEQALEQDAAILAGVFHGLRRRFPDLPAPVPLDSAEGRFRFFSAVRQLVHRLSRMHPLVLVLEDVHWADPSSLLLLRFLVESREPGRWLAVVAFRSHEITAGDIRSEIRDAILKEPMCVALELGGLASSEIGRLGELTAGRGLSERWAQELTARTEGNPLMIIELVRLLKDRGALERAPSGEKAFPSGARATIERRIDRLSSGCLEVLLRASVLGRSFEVDLLSATCDTSDREVLRALDEAATAHVIEHTGARGHYRFGHALLREVVYARLAASDRIQLHRRAGRELEQRHEKSPQLPLAALVHHFSQSPFQGELAKAIDYAARAAQEAMRMLAYPEAIEFYRQSLESLERIAPQDDARAAPLLQGLGLAQRGAGRHSDAIETYRRLIVQARAAANGELFAHAAVGLEEARYIARAAAESSIPLLDEALRSLHAAPTPLRARVLNSLAAALNVVNDARRDEISRQAVAVARQLDDPLALTTALVTRHVAIWGPDTLEERLAIGEELFALADRVGDGADSFGVGARIWGHDARMTDLLEIGDMSALMKAVDSATFEITHREQRASSAESLRISEDVRLTVHLLSVRLFRGTLKLLQGGFAETEALLAEVVSAAQKMQAGNVLAAVQIQFFGLRYLQGRVGEVVPLVRLILANNPGFEYSARAGLSMSLADLGSFDEAKAEVERIASLAGGLSKLPRDNFWVVALTTISEALFLMQWSVHARELYDLLEPFAARNALCSSSYCAGSVARYLGQLAALLEDYDLAARHFESALLRNRAIGAAPFVAMTEYDYALMLAYRGEPAARTRSLELLESATRAAEALGMRQLAERSRSLIASLQDAPRGDER